MSSALNNIRILDLSRGPCPGIAAMIMADFGAEVIHVPTSVDDLFETLPASRMWRRGQEVVSLDLPTQQAQLLQLCDQTDILLTNLSDSSLASRGIDLSELRASDPALIVCQISGFGDRGPQAELPAYEHLVAAACGRMLTFQGLVDRAGPVFSALQVGIHATAQSAVSGMLAALWQRQEAGIGTTVHTSLLQGMLPYEQGAMIARQFPQRFADLLPSEIPPLPPLPTLFYHPAQTADGSWMQFGNLLPHLFDNYLMVADLVDVLADPDFDAKQLRLPGEKHEAFRARMLGRIQEKSAADWMALCIANGGVVAGRYQTTQQALKEPDIVANGHVIEDQTGGIQIGPLARLEKTPAQPLAVAGDLTKTWQNQPRKPTQDHNKSDQTGIGSGPLAGIRVLELATIIAAPLGTSFLADMGAEVIKVEQIGGDPYRGFSFGAGSARVNAGKRSISLNLKSTRGQQVVTKLAAKADILIHNYRPGVPEKLGFGYDTVHALNPQLVYLQCNGYGPDGPGAHRPCTHPIPGAAMGGVLLQMGERVPDELQDFDQLKLWTSRLMRANEVNPDPNTALVVASSALLALVARPRSGGQRVFVDMFGANAYANHDDFLTYEGKPQRALPDANLYGLSACYRLYRCANEEWVFLAIPQSSEKSRFIDLLKSLGESTVDENLFSKTEPEITHALTNLFQTKSADEWEQLCTEARIGCVRADRYDPADYWLEAPQAIQMQLTSPATHPAWGDYQRHGANVSFEDQTANLGPPPLGGQHSREILRELDYDEATIEQAFSEGSVWSEPT